MSRLANKAPELMGVLEQTDGVPVHGPNFLFSKFGVSLYDPSAVEASNS